MTRKPSAIAHLEKQQEPHIIHMIPRGAPGYAEANGGAMVVFTPKEVDDLVRKLTPGEVITLDGLRRVIARNHGVTVACPVSTAMFANMGARAAEEYRSKGVPQAELSPWWRVLRKGGLLNPKLPGGVLRQAQLLAAEGVKSAPLRKELAVYDYEARQPDWVNCAVSP